MTELILGYQTAADEDVLSAFLTTAQEKYQMLEEVIAPIDERIAHLQQDWLLRPASFWQATLEEVQILHTTTNACLLLFDKAQSQAAPVPLVICATSIAYRGDLHSVNEEIEEVGILFTTFLQSPSSAFLEEQIRERQRLTHALEELSQTIHTAVHNARAKLDKAPVAQRKLLTPGKRKEKRSDSEEE